MTAQQFRQTADRFTKAYLEAALWASSAELGECDKCGRENVSPDPSTERHKGCGGKVRGTDLSFTARGYDVEQMAEEALDKIVADCAKFQSENAQWITDDNNLAYGGCSTAERAGHDFWLTRCGHGSGFQDGDWQEPAAANLTKSAHVFGEVYLYLGDDGLVYLG